MHLALSLTDVALGQKKTQARRGDAGGRFWVAGRPGGAITKWVLLKVGLNLDEGAKKTQTRRGDGKTERGGKRAII